MKIIDNYKEGDIILWIDVQAYIKGTLVHHVCEGNSLQEGIDFYYKNFYKEYHSPILCTYHLFTKEQLKNICKAA